VDLYDGLGPAVVAVPGPADEHSGADKGLEHFDWLWIISLLT
jgi:hypothetical protein